MLQAWGDYVLDYIKQEVEKIPNNYIIVQKYEGPRVKDTQSAISKVIRKGYTDPLSQMTDLVGVRVIVLLSIHLPVIDKIIENNNKWTYSKDRSIEQEQLEAPTVFAYQSNHYIVTAVGDFCHIDKPIQKGVKCEVQIRTLMQHAYAVTTHDTLYKPSATIPTKAERFMSSSMALLETADHLMCETMELVDKIISNKEELYSSLLDMYKKHINSSVEGNKQLNLFAIENLGNTLDKFQLNTHNLQNEIELLLQQKPFIVNRIKSRHESFWQEPMCLLAYLLYVKNSRLLKREWPLAIYDEQIALVFSDLGDSYTA